MYTVVATRASPNQAYYAATAHLTKVAVLSVLMLSLVMDAGMGCSFAMACSTVRMGNIPARQLLVCVRTWSACPMRVSWGPAGYNMQVSQEVEITTFFILYGFDFSWVFSFNK